MSREQTEKVAELLRQGWFVVAPNHPPPGAAVLIEDTRGRRWLVDAAGQLTPEPPKEP